MTTVIRSRSLQNDALILSPGFLLCSSATPSIPKVMLGGLAGEIGLISLKPSGSSKTNQFLQSEALQPSPSPAKFLLLSLKFWAIWDRAGAVFVSPHMTNKAEQPCSEYWKGWRGVIGPHQAFLS